MSALEDIAAERIRQLEKGYDADHDDEHTGGEIAQAAAALAMPFGWDPLMERLYDREQLWPDGVGPWNPREADRRGELVRAAAMLAAEVDRLDRAQARTLQAFLPRSVCWGGHPIQCATAVVPEVVRFVRQHPRLKVFSGLRVGSAGDHRCGYATDLVPQAYGDRLSVAAAFEAAERMRASGQVAYVEPLAQTWIPGNHHLHVSWKRCG